MPQELIVMLGAPGSGKGTQAISLAIALRRPHLSSGDLLRRECARQTENGKLAQAAMDRGTLVPDDLITDMVLDWLASGAADSGAVLDGFPRTIPQSVALEHAVQQRGGRLTGAIFLDVSEQVLMERLSGRRVCAQCGASFHTTTNPSCRIDQCDHCGGVLSQRSDDRREVVAARIAVYRRQTMPLIEYYASRGLLRSVDGAQAMTAVRERVLAAAAECPSIVAA